MCVYCYAYVSIHHSGSACCKCSWWLLLTIHDHTYCQLNYCVVHLGLNSRICWLQLISWYQWAWALQLAFYKKACWSLILFHWNGIIIISIIINQNHHNNNNNNIKNIQMMDTEVIQNTLRLKQTKMKTRYHNQTCFKAVMFGKKAVFVVS